MHYSLLLSILNKKTKLFVNRGFNTFSICGVKKTQVIIIRPATPFGIHLFTINAVVGGDFLNLAFVADGFVVFASLVFCSSTFRFLLILSK